MSAASEAIPALGEVPFVCFAVYWVRAYAKILQIVSFVCGFGNISVALAACTGILMELYERAFWCNPSTDKPREKEKENSVPLPREAAMKMHALGISSPFGTPCIAGPPRISSSTVLAEWVSCLTKAFLNSLFHLHVENKVLDFIFLFPGK